MKSGLVKQEPSAPSTRVIEIGGIKMEVDMRHVKKVEHYKVGTNIRVLVKDYSEYKSYGGVIIGFEEFKTRPSILIAYIKVSYGDSSLHFITYNSDTKDVEICLAEESFVPFEKSRVLECLNNSIQVAKEALLEAQNKKDYFEKNFNKYFEDTK
jgi:hypothetical protein